MPNFVEACRAAIGAQHVLTADTDVAPFVVDWRRRYHGRALAVLRPADAGEVAALVRLAAAHRVPLVPQGGNTGLCGGATPDGSGAQAVLSLRRLNRVRAVDPANGTLVAEAGCVLADVQQAAAAHDRLFPLSLAAEGSCTIGGNLATNAGGTAVLRYGNARELCLGLEAVTAAGEIWNGLRGLRKDNSGYDLRDLLIGAEGTLGIITAAELKLFPPPAARVTSLAAVASIEAAVALMNLAQRVAGPLLTGCELMSEFCLRLVARHYPALRWPFADAHPQVVLLELSDHESEAHARALFETLMARALDDGLAADALVAENLTQARAFWNLREHIPLAQADEGLNVKHDIALPASRLAAFVRETDAAIALAAPGARLVTFGHLGDGNLHYNVQAPPGDDPRRFLDAHQAALNRIVYDGVARHGGTFSAEHGIGQLKREQLAAYRTPVEIALLRTLKQALDPLNLLNPGKVVP